MTAGHTQASLSDHAFATSGQSLDGNSMLCLEQSSIGACTDEHQRYFRRLYSFRDADGRLDRVDLPFRVDCRAARTQLQNLGVDRRDFDRATGASAAFPVAGPAWQERRPRLIDDPTEGRVLLNGQ